MTAESTEKSHDNMLECYSTNTLDYEVDAGNALLVWNEMNSQFEEALLVNKDGNVVRELGLFGVVYWTTYADH